MTIADILNAPHGHPQPGRRPAAERGGCPGTRHYLGNLDEVDQTEIHAEINEKSKLLHIFEPWVYAS